MLKDFLVSNVLPIFVADNQAIMPYNLILIYYESKSFYTQRQNGNSIGER